MKLIIKLCMVLSSVALLTQAVYATETKDVIKNNLNSSDNQLSTFLATHGLKGPSTINMAQTTFVLPANYAYLNQQELADLFNITRPSNSSSHTIGMIRTPTPDHDQLMLQSDHSPHVSMDYVKNKLAASYIKSLERDIQNALAKDTQDGKPPVIKIELMHAPSFDETTHKLWFVYKVSKDNKVLCVQYCGFAFGKDSTFAITATAFDLSTQTIEQDGNTILQSIKFNEGNRYEDFK